MNRAVIEQRVLDACPSLDPKLIRSDLGIEFVNLYEKALEVDEATREEIAEHALDNYRCGDCDYFEEERDRAEEERDDLAVDVKHLRYHLKGIEQSLKKLTDISRVGPILEEVKTALEESR